MTRFNGKVVLVTGAARGIGKTIAECFVSEGAKVWVADILLEAAQATAKELTSRGTEEVLAVKADVSKLSDINEMMDIVEQKCGRLDILINNAGIQIRNPSIDFKEDDWDKLMNINLKATFFCSQAAANIMVKNGGGRMVNISSGTSKETTPGRAPYVISKAGVNALTAVLASEWAKNSIRVNAVAPGWIMTDMLQDGIRLGIVSEKQILSAVPMLRLASMKEIADAVVYLASDEASYITGQTLFVDGGWNALGLPQDEEELMKKGGVNLV
jgi:NAD(P)-dependent dehydrogenase (short-subunit alcohol dehydrogenase family)